MLTEVGKRMHAHNKYAERLKKEESIKQLINLKNIINELKNVLKISVAD